MFQLLFLLSVTIIINAVHKILAPDMVWIIEHVNTLAWKIQQ